MRIWPWSRIADLERANGNLNNRLADWEDYLSSKLDAQSRDIVRILTQVSTITPGLGRVIAKLDTRFAEDESNASPERKAESDKIAKDTIRRLEAEALARAPYNHDLGDKP